MVIYTLVPHSLLSSWNGIFTSLRLFSKAHLDIVSCILNTYYGENSLVLLHAKPKLHETWKRLQVSEMGTPRNVTLPKWVRRGKLHIYFCKYIYIYIIFFLIYFLNTTFCKKIRMSHIDISNNLEGKYS